MARFELSVCELLPQILMVPDGVIIGGFGRGFTVTVIISEGRE